MPEPKKPAHVPADATFSAKDNEWGLGKKVRNKCAGFWQYWAAPAGYLSCELVFPKTGRDFCESWKQYHPNGELAVEGRFDDGGTPVEQTWWKSTAKTPVELPHWITVPRNAWRIRMTTVASRPAYRYWDKAGVELDERGKPKASAKDVKAIKRELAAMVKDKKANETATEALQRHERVVAKTSELMGIPLRDEILKSHRIVFHGKPIAPAVIARAEKKIGARLPPSYVEFVTTKGLFSFDGEAARMYAPDKLVPLDEWHRKSGCSENDMASLYGNDKGLALWKQSLGFADGDRDLQLVAMYCFRMDSQNPKTHEACVWPFDQDEPERFAKPTAKVCATRGFDAHVSPIVDEDLKALFEDVFP